MFLAIKRWFQENPRIVFLVIVGAVLFGLFLGVITPLFATAGPAMADISGAMPTTATAGKRLEIDVSLDNVGASVIGQLCVGALVQGQMTPIDAIFQNVDTEPFVAGETGSWKVCGGELTSQSSAPVQLFFKTGESGTVQLVLSPMNGKQVVGQALNGTVSIHNA